MRRAAKRYIVLLEFLIALGILPGCVWSVPTQNPQTKNGSDHVISGPLLISASRFDLFPVYLLTLLLIGRCPGLAHACVLPISSSVVAPNYSEARNFNTLCNRSAVASASYEGSELSAK